MGVNTNCVSCANAAQQRLTGVDPSAVSNPSKGYGSPNDLLPSAPMGLGSWTSVDSATAELLARGEGATTPVVIKQGAIDHVITGTVRNGQVYLIDGQMGKIVTLQPGTTVRIGNP